MTPHGPALFTTSWDDGHPLDARMADLLSRHGFQGTFYVPLSNREGLPVLAPEEVRSLGRSFEIGSHTIDHCYLRTVDAAEARRQIAGGKDQIEQILGQPVGGFCYVGGHHTLEHRRMVAEAGFEYARTNASFHRALTSDPFRMPTTAQFYPHVRDVWVRHFVRHGHWGRRAGLFCVSLSQGDLMPRLRGMLDHVCRQGGVFHLWGHSWELDGFDGWRQLDDFLRYAADCVPSEDRLTNREVLRLAATRRSDRTASLAGRP
jgi:peptidoglycan/xylan/chitin deacetylase (PgdA/CDA1 family)